MRVSRQKLLRINLPVLALILMPVPGLGSQDPNNASQKALVSWIGKYEGTVKDSTGEAKVMLELVEDSGKFSGAMTTQLGVFKVIKGEMADGLLTLEFETKGGAHRLLLRQKDNKLVGTAIDGGKTPNIELRRVALDEITGEWDAAADAQGQPFPFTLSLKLEGEKVSGSSSSQLGDSTISSGAWKDGKLVIVLESGSGQIGLIATLQDGKLVGDYDFAGQLQGKWVAIKKK